MRGAVVRLRPPCRFCGHHHVVSYGRNRSGTRKYQCRACRRTFVLLPEKVGLYDAAVKRAAVHRVLNGEHWKQVAYDVGCQTRTLRQWVEATTSERCACGRKLTHVGMCRFRYRGQERQAA